MSENATKQHVEKKVEQHLESVNRELESGALHNVQMMLNDLHPAELAQMLESMPQRRRKFVWEMIEAENKGEVLLHVNDEVRAGLIENMADVQLVAAADGMDTDDLADLIIDLPDTVIAEVLRSMDKQDRSRLETVLAYPEDSAGGLMNTDTITVRSEATLDVVFRYLRLHGELPDHTDALIVVNRFDHYLGQLSLRVLLTSDPTQTVAEVMNREKPAIPVNMPDNEVAQIFENRDLISAPVVDAENKLLGRITIDDVVDVIRDEADHSLMSMAGLDEEGDMFAPVLVSTRRRAVWLGINLITAFLAAWVIGLFQTTLDKVVALAVLMPVAASMGGVAGTQTLTLVIRGLALGQIGKTNARTLLWKELRVGLLNGILWAVVVAIVAIAWFDDARIGGFIAAAMLINLITAAAAGFSVPLLLRRFGMDPALGGSVTLTTITDVVGYASFLGLAAWYLF